MIGFDKQEIVDVSTKIDTYETSIQPYEDCCTIFVAKHPVTKPNIKVIKRSEEKLQEEIDEMVKKAIDTAGDTLGRIKRHGKMVTKAAAGGLRQLKISKSKKSEILCGFQSMMYGFNA